MNNDKDLNLNQLLGLLGDLLGQINEKDLKDFLAKLDTTKIEDELVNMTSQPSLQAIIKMAKQNKIPIASIIQLAMKYVQESKKKQS
ncbi:MAG: hypothetical protein ACYCX4_10935 [Bacillota bacterium]